MSDELIERVAEVLGEHEYALEMRVGSICVCGFVPEVDPSTLQSQQDYHRAHLAAALVPLIREREAAAWDVGWDARAKYIGTDGTHYRGHNPYRAALDGEGA